MHVVSAQSVNPERVRAFAAKPGSAAEAGERDKRRRYKPEHNPRAALVPFVVEALGRPGPQAMQLLRAMAPQDPTVRGLELTRAWAELSTLIQVRRANLLLASEYTHDVAVRPRGGEAGAAEPRQLQREVDEEYVDETRSAVQPGLPPAGSRWVAAGGGWRLQPRGGEATVG